MPTAIPFLMFQGGTAQAALDLYHSAFEDCVVVRMEKYGEGEQGPTGTVKLATFRLYGREFRCIDSPIEHAFSFTPSTSTFIEFESVEELERVFRALSEGGEILMPPDNYGFSQMFAWINDRFGVSWQLNLAES